MLTAALLAAALLLQGCGFAREILYAPRPSKAVVVAWANGAPQQIDVPTADNKLLDGYYWPGAPGDRDIILFFHGRHGNAETGARAAQYLAGQGNAVLVASYRGFGANRGHATQVHMLEDAAAFIAFARMLAGPDGRIWLVGHSIGAAVVQHAAPSEPDIAAIFALSSFMRVAEAAPRIARAFIPDEWDNGPVLTTLDRPIIFIQGALDRYVPADSGERLLAAATGPAALVVGSQSRHNPDMRKLSPWISGAIAALAAGGLDNLPPLPKNWVEQARHP